ELTPPIVVLPPDPPSAGYWLSPMLSWILSIGNPSVSPATIRMAVRVPVPRSWLPILIFTEPSEWILISQLLLWPRPPQVWMARPKPRLFTPEPCPRGCHALFQP